MLFKYAVVLGMVIFSSVGICDQMQSNQLTTTQFSQTNLAQSGIKTPVMNTSAFNQLSDKQQQHIANIFGLTADEYQHYLHYMNDTMDGYEYQSKTNPNIVLAAHAKDQAHYEKYLKQAVQEDHNAIARMLKVSSDYTQMAKARYPSERPIMTPQMRAMMNNPLKSGDEVQLYCHVNNPTCSHLLNIVLPKVVKTHGAKLDIFAVGSEDKKDIVNFAKVNQIGSATVSSGKVTLNMGTAAFSYLQDKSKDKLPLPLLVVRRDGKITPVNLSGKGE